MKRLVAWLFAIGTLLFLVIAYRAPGLVSRLAREDQVVETLSAVLLLLASLAFASVGFRVLRAPERGWLAVLVPALMSLVAFVIAMEEISWGQRLLDIETPAVLAANDQGEMNFHNLATFASENAYYFAGFFAFVLAPFLVDHARVPEHALIESFAPTRFLIIPAAVFVSFNSFEMWNVGLTQLAFFVTVFVLLHYGLVSRGAGRTGALYFFSIGVVVVTQWAFFTLGPRFSFFWLASEYKEFLIPLVMLLYSLELMRRAMAPGGILRTRDAGGASAELSQPSAATSS